MVHGPPGPLPLVRWALILGVVIVGGYLILSPGSHNVPEVNIPTLNMSNISFFGTSKTEVHITPRQATHYSLDTQTSWMKDSGYYGIKEIPENRTILTYLATDDDYYVIRYWIEHEGYFVLETTEARLIKEES